MAEAPRRLVDEMPAKLNEIERLAREWFTEKMAVNGYMFDANGNVVEDPRYPHDPVIVKRSLTPEESARPLQETWAELQSDLQTFRLRVERFYQLDPLDFTILVGKLGGTVNREFAEGHLLGGEGAPTSVHDRIGYAYKGWLMPVDGLIGEKQWSGDAAKNFHERFLWRFLDVSQHQQAFAKILAMAAQVCHDGITVAHRRLLNIADVTIGQLSGGTGQSRQFAEVETLSWASMITAGLSVIPPLGMAAGTFLGWTSFLTGIAGYARSKDNEPEDPETIASGSAPQIVQSAMRKVVKTEGDLADIGDQIAAGLDKDMDSPTGFASSSLRLDRPTLADGPGDMKRMTIDDNSAMNNDLVVAVADVYKAGYVHLPGAAIEYTQARAKLLSCVPSPTAHDFLGRSLQTFTEARDILANVLGNVGESLTGCGEALVAVARGYELTEEENAVYLQHVKNLIQPVYEAPRTPRSGAV